MGEFLLERFANSPHGTFGRLRLADSEWFTVEKPWNNNVPQTSCIPAANYAIKLGMYYGGDGPGGKPDYPAYEIQGVPERSLIKMHKANIADELLGCIAPGKELGFIKGKWAVVRSGEAFEEMMTVAAKIQPTVIRISWRTP